MRNPMTSYTVEQAKLAAEKFCSNNAGWEMICDIEDSDSLYKGWNDMDKKVKAAWRKKYGMAGAQDAWESLADKPCKVPYKFISGAGEVYDSILDVPAFHNSMMIFKVS